MRVAVGLFGYQNFFGGDVAKAVDFARIAEAEGIDLVSITDHVVMGPRTDRYPYGPPERGRGPSRWSCSRRSRPRRRGSGSR